jgi:hypothetical protein
LTPDNNASSLCCISNILADAFLSQVMQAADELQGGFFRYTTDPDWQTPHFEKMLYDNAQLAALYLKANRQWPNQGFADIAARQSRRLARLKLRIDPEVDILPGRPTR